MNKKSFISLSLAIILGLMVFSGMAWARSLQVTDDFLHQEIPLYIRLSIGNHQGCDDLKNCPSHSFAVSVSSVNAQMTLAKEILIGSDELLNNSLKDTGLPADNLNFSFATPFYKGVILKLFPDVHAATSDLLTIKITEDGGAEKMIAVPYLLLSPDSLSVLATASQVDSKYADWLPLSDQLQLQVLSLGLNQAELAHQFRNKLQIINRMMALERFARDKLLDSTLSNLTYQELQTAFGIVWNNVLFSDLDTQQFNHRYERLKFMLNKGESTPALLVGNLKRLLLNIQLENES